MPRPKLINDNRLTELFRQGKSLKEIGKELNVSSVAVHKRIKRLSLSRMPDSLEKLTDKQQAFCIEVSKGNSPSASAMKAYDCKSYDSAKNIASDLISKTEIRKVLSDLMEIHLPQGYRIQKLRQHTDHQDPSVSLKALDLSWKLDGSYAPEKHLNLTANISPVDMSKYLIEPSKEDSHDD